MSKPKKPKKRTITPDCPRVDNAAPLGVRTKEIKAADAGITSTAATEANGRRFDAITHQPCAGKGCVVCGGLGFTKQYTLEV